MYRIDRARLDAAVFEVVETIPIRFDDVDVQSHVNNAAAVVILQEGRANFNRRLGLADGLGGLRAMVAALHVEYAAEVHYPGEVSVATGVLRLGRTSFSLAQRARQDGRSCLYAEAVLVLVDADGPAPLPDGVRAAYTRLLLT